MKIRFYVAAISLLFFTSVGYASSVCKGDVWLPTTTNWNNALPIVMGGTSSGGGLLNPADMKMPPVCVCKFIGPVPVPGIGITYWEPLYIAEVTNMPGCLSSLGGVKVLPRALTKYTESTSALYNADYQGKGGNGNLRNMQIHWMAYPLFKMLDVFTAIGCQSGTAGFALGGLTEINPLWQTEALSNIFYPLTFLVAAMPAQLACIPDAMTSVLRQPIDPLFWCVGSQGLMYPLTGWSSALENGGADTNLLLLSKFMQTYAQTGALLTTIGTGATCNSHYSPFLKRGQFRFEPIQPVPSPRTATLGMPVEMWGGVPPLNPADRIDNNFLIWQGRQCCFL